MGNASPPDEQHEVLRLEREIAGLDARLRLLQGKAGGGSSEALRAWTQVLLVPVVLFMLGYWLKDTVDQAFKERQLEQSGLAQVREQLTELYSEEVNAGDALRVALAIGAFGGVAAQPLIEAVNLGGDSRRAAATRGLLTAGLIDHDRVCEALAATVVDNQKIYQWWTKQDAAELMGFLKCIHFRLQLRELCSLLKQGEDALRATVMQYAGTGRATNVAINVQRALAALGQEVDCCPPGFRCGPLSSQPAAPGG